MKVARKSIAGILKVTVANGLSLSRVINLSFLWFMSSYMSENQNYILVTVTGPLQDERVTAFDGRMTSRLSQIRDLIYDQGL